MVAAFVGQVYEHFEKVTDPRVNRGSNYPLIEMVFVALCGAICDCNAWTDVANLARPSSPGSASSCRLKKGSFARHVHRGVCATRHDRVLRRAGILGGEWRVVLKGETVAFDGKRLRGSFDAATDKSALHSVSAWACGLKMCIALQSVAEKSNEIPAVQQLIDMLDLSGAVVTADAMHCQRETAEKIVARMPTSC